MKENTLLEMKNKLESIGRVLQALIHEIENTKTMAFGNNAVIKKLKEYDGVIEQLKEETKAQQTNEQTDEK